MNSTNSETTTPERLFLLDGMALAYRAYFAFISRPLINSKGMNTSAIYGFVTSLMRILADEKPDRIAVVFDTKAPTFRHAMYKEYKATRDKMPEDMSGQMSLLKDIVRAFNIPLLELSGYEADDIIGTLALRAQKERVITFMVTGDKDFMQLITPYIKILRPGKGGDDPEVIEEPHVLEKFGVTPAQVTDVLGLIGDKSDNVPGVPGIGEKTAIPLIQQYGSMEQLYENIEKVGQRGVREKLINNKELAFLSKKLVTIDTNVPVDIDFHKLKAAPPDTGTLARMFGELEFRSLAAKLGNVVQAVIETQIKPVDTAALLPRDVADIHSEKHEYHTILSREAFDQFVKRLKTANIFALQTITTSTIAMQAEMIGLSFAMKEHEAFYIEVRQESSAGSGFPAGDLFSAPVPQSATSTSSQPALPFPLVVSKLKPILENPAIKKVGHNLKYTMLVMNLHGIEMQGVEFDTMVASYVLRADGQHGRDAMAMECLNYKITSYEDLVGKGKSLKHITELPLETVAQYAAEDADITLRIYNCQILKLKEMEQLKLCEDVEFPLVSVLARMESEGIALDVPYLADMSKDLARQLENLIGDIYRDAGERFNINSTQQLGEVLFNKLKLPTVRKTKTGFSTDAGVLEALRGQHAIIDRMLEYRQLSKLKSTYVDALPLLINSKTKRIHTSFNQTVALTGRLSGADPNLQNIPIRTELGQAIRKAFIPGEKNNLILSADYSQIELRVMAHISADEGLLEAFNNNEDIHTSTAAKVFGMQPADISRDMRRKAKEVNFGIMYGIGPFGLATRLEISQGEAKEIIQRYFERFPKVKQYINDTMDSARRKGYVSTLLGRRRYLADINSKNFVVRSNAERQAINMPIQGTAADMIKIAMIAIDKALGSRKPEGRGPAYADSASAGRQKSEVRSRMLLQVHDELVFEVPPEEVAMMRELVLDKMQNALKLAVPVRVDVGVGKNWLEAH